MEGFRFILENPHPNAPDNKQRKRARLVTACDSCRVKKIKCQQPVPNGRCEACKTTKTQCLFGDRDRYQAERGVSCTWNSPGPVEEVSDSTEGSSRKRKLTQTASSTTSELWRSTSGPNATGHSRGAAPARGSITVADYRYFHPEQQAGPSVVNEFNTFPQVVPQVQDTDLNPATYDQLPLFDPNRPRFPHPNRMRYLGPMFFDHVGLYFPFLDRFDVLRRIEHRTCSAILSNCIAGLAIRFANFSHPNVAAGSPFYDMAKTLASHVVSVPSVEALHALICITWAEYGSGHDDGFWMYSRMAIAMCLDLGLGNEATIQLAATPEVRHRLRLTWWMVVSTADIAASWATGRPATLDLDHYDTKLPEVTDDLSLLFQNIAALFVLRGKLSRVLDAHVENQGGTSLDWGLSELQVEVENISKALPSTMVFNKENLACICNRRIGHLFVQMHILIHAVSALVNRPSLLPSYGLPVPTEGPRVDAARSCAKSLADILLTVENVAPQTLRDPFMDLSILVACRVLMADGDAQITTIGVPASPSSTLLAGQWKDTFMDTCKKSLVRVSASWGGGTTFDSILERHGGGLLIDDLQFSVSSSMDILATPSGGHQWLLQPNLLDDGASDSSGSFRSSSRELSPRLTPSAIINVPKYAPFNARGSPLVREVDDSGVERELSLHVSEFFIPGSGAPGANGYDSFPSYFDESCALQLSMDNAEAHRLLDVDMWSRKDMSFNRLTRR